MQNAQESPGLTAFNGLDDAAARLALLACCSSPVWAQDLLSARPFDTKIALLDRAEAAVAAMTESDLDDALAGHPRIGERLDVAGPGPGSQASRREQAGVTDAPPALKAALAEGNERYEERFGHVYLVCATGKRAAELLAILQERLANNPATERTVLRQELGKINRIRLERLLEQGEP